MLSGDVVSFAKTKANTDLPEITSFCDPFDTSVYYFEGSKGVCPEGEICDTDATIEGKEIPCKVLNRKTEEKKRAKDKEE